MIPKRSLQVIPSGFSNRLRHSSSFCGNDTGADTRGKPYAAVLQLVIDGVEWSLDLSDEMVRVAGQNRLLPAEEHGTVAYYDDRGNFNIHSPAKGVLLQCVANYHVCTLTLSGNDWFRSSEMILIPPVTSCRSVSRLNRICC